MPTASLTCLGVGDGFPCADRHHASFLYRFGKTSILVDCGEPVDSRLQASGLSHNLIDSLFISHLHADHIGGFFMLMQGCWLQGRRKDLHVYAPKDAVKPLRDMLKAVFLFDELLQFRVQFTPLKSGTPRAVRNVRITPFPTTHLDRARADFQKKYAGAFACYCFLLEAGRLRIGHSADLGRPEDLEPLLVKPLDLLVCEIAHFRAEEIFSYLRGRRIKRVAFVHLAGAYWANLAEVRRLAARMLPHLSHTFPRDGQIIRL